MPHIETDHGALFYTLSPGPTDGPTLILIHGAGGTRLHWPAELRRLDGVSVYTLDLPGHGNSGGRGSRSIKGYAEAVDAFFDTIGIPQAVVVGHSMGGAIAMTLALDLCTRTAGLVLIATGARLRVAPAILDGIGSEFERSVELITRFAWSQEAPPRLIELGHQALLETAPGVLQGDLKACDGFDVMTRLEEIEVPTLVISGSSDQLTPAKYGRFLAERIPGAHLTIIEKAAHMVMLEQPAEVAKAVQGFLERSSLHQR